MVPPLPTAQPLLGLKRTNPFRLFVVGGEAPTRTINQGYAIKRRKATTTIAKVVERKFLTTQHLAAQRNRVQ